MNDWEPSPLERALVLLFAVFMVIGWWYLFFLLGIPPV